MVTLVARYVSGGKSELVDLLPTSASSKGTASRTNGGTLVDGAHAGIAARLDALEAELVAGPLRDRPAPTAR